MCEVKKSAALDVILLWLMRKELNIKLYYTYLLPIGKRATVTLWLVA